MFDCGVSSADITSTSIVFRARVNNWQAGVPVLLHVWREQDGMTAYSQSTPAGVFGAEKDYNCKVVVDCLEPATRYGYQFTYMGEPSPIGSTQTLPAATASPQTMRVAILTCQHWQEGYYQALAHMAAQNPDLVIHTGDYIYELVKSTPLPGREMSLPDGLLIDEGAVPSTKEGYRYIYRTYQGDAALQAAHAAAPWFIMWDDHEGANDLYWNAAYNCPGSPTHPFNDNPAAMRELRAMYTQAFYEYTPMRGGMPLYRSVQWGQLVEFLILDCRTYRSPHPCGEAPRDRIFTPGCPEMLAPTQTMLGAEQLAWLLDRLANSTAQHKAIVSPVMLSDIWLPGPEQRRLLKTDGWSGYQHERQLILDAAPAGTVFFSGDLHAAMQAVLLKSSGDIAGKEFATPAVSSKGIGPGLLNDLGLDEETHQAIIRGHNPGVGYFNGYTNGYLLVDFYPNAGSVALYLCDAQVGSEPVLAKTWVFTS